MAFSYRTSLIRAYVALTATVAAMIGAMILFLLAGQRLTSHQVPLLEATTSIKIELAEAHYWFEEVRADHSENIHQVWRHFDEALWYADAILHGGQKDGGTFPPASKPELRTVAETLEERILASRKSIEARYETGEPYRVDEQADHRHEVMFRELAVLAADAATLVRLDIARRSAFRQRLLVFVIAGSFLAAVLLGVVFYRHEAGQRLAEQELWHEKAYTESVVDSLPGVFYLFDRQGRMLRWNRNFERISGYSADELRVRAPWDFFEGNDREYITRQFRAVFEEGQATAAADLVTKDGRAIPHYFTGARIERDDEWFLVGMGIDVTEQKRATAMIEDLARFPSENPNPVMRVAKDGIILYANLASDFLLEFWGCRRDGPLPEVWRQIVAQVLSTGKNQLREVDCVDKVYAMTCAPLHNSECVNLYAMDVTDRKRAEESLRAMQDELLARQTRERELVEAELSQARAELVKKTRLATLGQLTATVSHEIRNPLGSIRTAIYSIAQEVHGHSPLVDRALERAERNVLRCDRIIEELLDYTRVGVLKLEPTRVDRWLAEVLDEYPWPDGIAVTRSFAAGVEVSIDRDQLRRCIVNLLTNACQAMIANEPGTACVTVETALDGERIKVRIRDTGHGISPADMDRIFEPFYTTKGFGVGLGLPMVEQLMRQLGGDVTLESETGQGTIAVLSLPPTSKKEP
ncbi:MAG: PAS domain S-box protein [Pirellulaceae bacterium]|nr:PAS domain S-box protein [Pirellulaceae bacterium]